ncbi:hypothetical protein EVC12_249 [Rhizobium phage RHph_I42]|nr:hypothetical protein EVC12_249 [Rhizobium phage RHph_I42]
MAYKSGVCYACGRKRPVESHHVHPLEYGGKQEGRQELICADCHNILHREGEHYHKHGSFQELDHIIPFNPDPTSHGYRIRELAGAVIAAKNLFNSGEVNAGEQRLMTQVSWDSQEELLIAHDVKRMMGFKSLPRAIKALVFEKHQQLNSGKKQR